MQTFVMPDFPDIVRKRIRKYPGGLAGVARAMGVSRSALNNKFTPNEKYRSEFTVKELKLLDSILHFTEEEKAILWR